MDNKCQMEPPHGIECPCERCELERQAYIMREGNNDTVSTNSQQIAVEEGSVFTRCWYSDDVAELSCPCGNHFVIDIEARQCVEKDFDGIRKPVCPECGLHELKGK